MPCEDTCLVSYQYQLIHSGREHHPGDRLGLEGNRVRSRPHSCGTCGLECGWAVQQSLLLHLSWGNGHRVG